MCAGRYRRRLTSGALSAVSWRAWSKPSLASCLSSDARSAACRGDRNHGPERVCAWALLPAGGQSLLGRQGMARSALHQHMWRMHALAALLARHGAPPHDHPQHPPCPTSWEHHASPARPAAAAAGASHQDGAGCSRGGHGAGCMGASGSPHGPSQHPPGPAPLQHRAPQHRQSG